MTNFITINVATGSGTIATAGELVSEHFAITPTYGRYEPDGEYRLVAGPCLTHVPTGRRVTADHWLDLRLLAVELEALPVDWDDMSGWTDDQKNLPWQAIRKVLGASSSANDGWPWPDWAGDESTPALSLLARTLDGAVQSHERFSTVCALGSEAKAALSEELGRKVDTHLLAAQSAWAVSEYGVAYLLAVLHRVDPAAADRAARTLVADWDAGDSMGEWAYQWRDELAQGRPLKLHDFPSCEIAGPSAVSA